jgi:uncharacterized protein YcfL
MKKILIIILSLLIITGCACSKKNNNESKLENNLNEELIKEQIISDIQISNINIVYENEISTFTAIVTNNGKSNKKIGVIDIIFKDEEGQEIITLKGLIDKNLKPNESSSINAGTSIDLRNAKNIEYKIN